MSTKIRYAALLRELSIRQKKLSLNDLYDKPVYDDEGKLIPARSNKIKLTFRAAYQILFPYISSRFIEQARAVIPLAIYLMAFQIFILRQSINDAAVIASGLVAVMIGLMFFMEGLRLGLMPLGEKIGNLLPIKSPLPVVLLIAFLLGIGVTFAEPAIGALKAAGATVKYDQAPILYEILTTYASSLVLMVGIGVGLAAVLGTLRFVHNWSLKPLIYFSIGPVLLLTCYISVFHPEVRHVIGLAWDCGAVTTGPVTVPLVLALGIGVAGAVSSGKNPLSGFGIVTLASLFPIFGALVLGIYIDVAGVSHVPESTTIVIQATSQDLFSQTPWQEILSSVRAIIPLVLFLMVVMKFLLKEKLNGRNTVYLGIILALVGMAIFNIGLTYGLSKLGDQAGSLVPAAFTNLDHIPDSPLYWQQAGLLIALLFAFFLGLRATLAEPALNVLGQTVEHLTDGAFKKMTLMYAVSFGVGLGITLGVAKLIFHLNIIYFLLPGYLLLLFLTYCSSEEFVNIAWDSAGVTTGPVTVPLVLAMGIGLGNATGIVEGFGILSMASLCPIASVLCTGLYVQYRNRGTQ